MKKRNVLLWCFVVISLVISVAAFLMQTKQKQNLQDEIDELNQKLLTQTSTNNSQADKIDELNGKLQNCNNVISQLSITLSEEMNLRRAQEQKNKEQQTLDENQEVIISNLVAALSQQKNLIDLSSTRIDNTNTRINELEARLGLSIVTVNALKEEVEAQKELINSYNDQFIALNQTLQQLTLVLSEQQDKINQQDIAIGQLGERVDEQEEAQEITNGKIEELVTQIGELLETIELLTEKINTLESQLSSIEDLEHIYYAFYNADGTLLYESYCHKDTAPIYIGETPVKNGEYGFIYTFTGWDKDETKPISEPTIYTAQYDLEEFSYADGAFPRTLVEDEELIAALDEISTTDVNGYVDYDGFKYYKYTSETAAKRSKYYGTQYYRVEPVQWTEIDMGGLTFQYCTEVIDILEYTSFSNMMSIINDMDFINRVFKYEDISLNRIFFTTPSLTTNMFNLAHTEGTMYDIDEMNFNAEATDYAKARGVVSNRYYVADGTVYSNGEIVTQTSGVGLRLFICIAR